MWCMRPARGLRLRNAWSRAARASVLSLVSLVAQPTTRREKRSSSTARYSQPWAVAMYVTSPTHATFGAVVSNLRSRMFGAIGSSCLESVVRTKRRLLRPRRPFSVINRSTRFLPTFTPFACSSRCTRGLP